MMSNKASYKTSIGGQALIEGIMMRGVDKTVMSTRLPNGDIDTEVVLEGAPKKNFFKKMPVIRGVLNFIESLSLGYKCLNKSAEKSMGDIEVEDTKFDKFLSKIFGDKFSSAVSFIGIFLGIIISISLFILIPTYIVDIIPNLGDNYFIRSLLEGILKIIIFILYLAGISNIKDVKRLFQYHGAEHKTIFCYENHKELTVENVKKYTRFHPRCGTSFILIVLVISIIIFSIIKIDHVFLRTAIKLLMLPIVVGVGYELIKFLGRHDNWFTRFLSSPGLWLQNFTTKEPDDGQIEIAIVALKEVIPAEKGLDKW